MGYEAEAMLGPERERLRAFEPDIQGPPLHN